MLRITSLNVNGIRSAFRKGLQPWLEANSPHIVCLQEIKISSDDLTEDLRNPPGYQGFFHHAEKKGYSGVGIYLRDQAASIAEGMDCPEFDREGRILRADWKDFSVISAYLPSGSSGDERQQAKYRFLDHFGDWIDALMQEHRSTGREFVICGDWNIAHKEIDLKNWKGNLKNSGFLPEERQWLTEVFDRRGFVDVFRQLVPDAEQYTWWSNRGQAWAKNVGWRIDYQIATPGLAGKARQASIYKDERFSDHAPLTIDYTW
ncbi:exodeoxyribonuclease III [Paracandidimonas soli]|uniref:Exodeoxyribonuclease-3 n=1 Tax=Paracandidimonas soli TaxID=1917182 RepID=A0A4R3V4A1_9BURK|nr:exodeoxyribonuclease III [Paracandidimonas soli]TCU98351.1 exodeoxyribonuclease-3 [Paracandidimonas soli]